MKSKLPIIRAALEAGLTLEFTIAEMAELENALGIPEQEGWNLEGRLSCDVQFIDGFFYLDGHEKKYRGGYMSDMQIGIAFKKYMMGARPGSSYDKHCPAWNEQDQEALDYVNQSGWWSKKEGSES